MRDPARIDEVLSAVYDAWRATPDQRFGQLVENVRRDSDLGWNIEDDTWTSAFRKWEQAQREAFVQVGDVIGSDGLTDNERELSAQRYRDATSLTSEQIQKAKQMFSDQRQAIVNEAKRLASNEEDRQESAQILAEMDALDNDFHALGESSSDPVDSAPAPHSEDVDGYETAKNIFSEQGRTTAKDARPTTIRDLLCAALKRNNETESEIETLDIELWHNLDEPASLNWGRAQEFHDPQIPEPGKFTAWTAKNIYFNDEYDGVDLILSAPRFPNDYTPARLEDALQHTQEMRSRPDIEPDDVATANMIGSPKGPTGYPDDPDALWVALKYDPSVDPEEIVQLTQMLDIDAKPRGDWHGTNTEEAERLYNYLGIRGIGPGWWRLILDCHKELMRICPDYEINQVKQKLGGLKYYINSPFKCKDQQLSMQEIIDRYERRSRFVCEDTGHPGVLMEQTGSAATLNPRTAGPEWRVATHSSLTSPEKIKDCPGAIDRLLNDLFHDKDQEVETRTAKHFTHLRGDSDNENLDQTNTEMLGDLIGSVDLPHSAREYKAMLKERLHDKSREERAEKEAEHDDTD